MGQAFGWHKHFPFQNTRTAPFRHCVFPARNQIFCLHGGLSPNVDTLDTIRSLDRIQEVRKHLLALLSLS